jgi:hypothetical protein
MGSDGCSNVRFFRRCWLVAMTAILLVACGGGGSTSQQNGDTSAVTFQVSWDRPDGQAAGPISSSLTDCADVNTVSASVYDTDGTLLSTGGPWDCTAGSGVITGIPANYYATIAVAGHAAGGLVLYRGQSAQTFFLSPGGTVDAGLIVAGTFVPTLVSPADQSVLAPVDLELQWNAMSGADGYQVTLATDNAFGDAQIVQEISVDGGTTSTRPDVSGLQEDTLYYWRVQAVDGAGNLSAPSQTRRFSLSTALLGVTITGPSNNAYAKLSLDTTFSAQVTDASGAPLSSTDLAVITWSSSIDGQIGSQLNFTSNSLSLGTHTITLTVEDLNGLTGNAAIQLNVVANLPPVAQILDPADGATLSYSQLISMAGFTWQGSATDYEDGVDVALQWSLVKLDNPGTVLWTGTGSTPMVSLFNYIPAPGTGLYRVTLVATDSMGATDTVYHDVTFN